MSLVEKLKIPREVAAQLASETVDIIVNRKYMVHGAIVDLSTEIRECVTGTITYYPDVDPRNILTKENKPNITVTNETTLEAALRLDNPVVLNMASAKHAGGGFLRGTLAQEEYLARNTCLFACIDGHPMYRFHEDNKNPLYSDWVIYSPNVPVIRDDYNNLIDKSWSVSILTSPAVNAGEVEGKDRELIAKTMDKRIEKLLRTAIHHNHRNLVLGAWGCGVFANDGSTIASLFKKHIDSMPYFDNIIFAIADISDDLKFITPFKNTFN